MATATLQYRVNSGALQTATYAAVAAGDVISLTAASFAGWATPAARWEVIYYPAGVSTPTDWTADTTNLRFYYLANSGASGVTPPDITLPATWGKWVFRLTVHDGTGTAIVSNDIVLEIVSDNGLHDLATGEKAQYGGARNWPKVEQANLRTIDTFMTSGGAADLTAVPFLINGTDPSGALTAETNIAALSSRLDLVRHAAAADTVLPALGLRRSTSGTAASGIGTGIEFEAEDNAGAYMVSAQILFTASSVTPGQVTGPLAIKTLNGSGSLVQRMALGSSGEVTFDGLGTGTAGIAHVSTAGVFSTSKIVDADVDAAAAIAGSKIDPDFGAQQTVTQDLQVTGLSTGVLHADGTGVVSSSLVVNADVSASAAIAGSKITPAFGAQAISGQSLQLSGLSTGIAHVDSGGNFTSSTIVNADVSASAAIAGTKIDPNFGTQNVFARGNYISQLDTLGTTKTVGIAAVNTTASGTQVSPQIGGSAAHSGGTVHSYGLQLEPQSAARAILRLCYGTGAYPANAPSSTGLYLDTSDGTFGLSLHCGTFVSSNGNGFRMALNGGGMKENGSGRLNFSSSSTSESVLFDSALAAGDTDPIWDFQSTVTRTAGTFVRILDSAGTWFSISSATGTKGHPSINGVDQGYWRVTNDTSTTLNVTAADTYKFFTLANAGAVTVNLPAGATGLRYWFKNKGAGTATLTPNGSEKLFTNAQVATFALATGDTALIAWDGTDWSVLA